MPLTDFSLDLSFLYASQNNSLPEEGVITNHLQQQTKVETDTAIRQVEEKLQQGEYGFINVLTQKEYVDQTRQVHQTIAWAKNVVVVGIGGSDLGARALQQAVQPDKPPQKVLFHGDSTDPTAISDLLKKINLADTVFIIISKSGQTVETISQYLFFKKKYQEKTEHWAKHFVFITDQASGILRQEAQKNSVETLPIPDSVGGRFSVQTTVGLLPALCMGINIELLLSSLAEASNSQQLRQLAQQFATSQYQLLQKNIAVTVFMPYSIQLEETARWFRQLWAESLGKNGLGILPIQARGPADQHSQLQFYQQGTLLHSVLFLRIKNFAQNYTITDVDLDEVKYLEGHSFGEIVNIEQQATALALRKVGRGSATIELKELSVETIAYLLLFFELAVVYLAEMLEVNAFDQPGVEESKNMMYALLGKEGYEEVKEEIEQLQ